MPNSMLKDYNRVTRESSVDDLRPELSSAILEHAQARQLGDFESTIRICIETRSERLSTRRAFGLRGSGAHALAHYTAAIVAPPWLIWAISSSTGGTTTFSARLDSIRVKDCDTKAMIEDDGITITTRVPGDEEESSAFLGLAPGPVATKFKGALREAIETNSKG